MINWNLSKLLLRFKMMKIYVELNWTIEVTQLLNTIIVPKTTLKMAKIL